MPKANPKIDALTEASLKQSTKEPVNPVKRSGEKVTVACKLPHGLRLRLFKMVDTIENVSGNNQRTVKIARPFGEEVVIKGVAVEFGKDKALTGGYALTTGIDKAFFDEWMHQNAEHDAVKNNLIFAASTRDEIEGMAEDHKATKSGLEPLDMSIVKRGERMVAADPRLPRSNNANLTGITENTEKANAA
jgi:hypothetical protein